VLTGDFGGKKSRLYEVARLLVRFDHVASIIVNANHGQTGNLMILPLLSFTFLCSASINSSK
jgi:hypothetical protein